MAVIYINCIGKQGVKNFEKTFHDIIDANDCFEERMKEDKWEHVEITQQLKVYLPITNEIFTS